MQFISQLASFAVALVSNLGYPGIVLVMALENIFPPIPSEAVMPLAGFLTTTGRFNLYLAIVAGVLGSLLGGLVLYYLGFWIGGKNIRSFLERYGKYLMVSTGDLNAAEQWFNRYGERAVLFARVVPVVRSIVSIPAGFIKMPLASFILYSTIGITAWTIFLTMLGVFLGKNWERLGPWLKNIDFLVTGALLAAVSLYFYKRRKNRLSR